MITGIIDSEASLFGLTPVRAKATICVLRMSSGASFRADIREGREIIAEHQEADPSYVLECLRPSGFTPSARGVS